jgi:hypothetical protein
MGEKTEYEKGDKAPIRWEYTRELAKTASTQRSNNPKRVKWKR